MGAVGTLSVFNTQFHFISLFVKTSLFSTAADGPAAAQATVSHRSVEPHLDTAYKWQQIPSSHRWAVYGPL